MTHGRMWYDWILHEIDLRCMWRAERSGLSQAGLAGERRYDRLQEIWSHVLHTSKAALLHPLYDPG